MTQPQTFTVTPNPEPVDEAEREVRLANPGFGQIFTDHMVIIDWNVEQGWHDARVVPYGPLQLDPANAVFHYGQEVFEGLKAYRHDDGSIWTFRPEKNGERLQRSCRRLALPELAVDDFIEAVRQLVDVDQSWVPPGDDQSLYLRPFMIANENFLGVRSAHHVTFMVIASPAGAYFPNGVKPLSIWLSEHWSRAGRGGTGKAKCGGNYAASLLPTNEAYTEGCQQVLFLDAETEQYVEELGGMNVFFVYRDGRVVTPESDSILEGVTRDSILQLARDRGYSTEQRRFALAEWREGVASGEITEVFACGTAAVITPIGELKWRGGSVGDLAAPAGELTMQLRDELTSMQYGRVEDRHGWLTRLV